VSVALTKLIAFGLSAAIAGFAGGLTGYQDQAVTADSFTVLGSILIVALAYVGGIATVAGAFVAGLLTASGLIAHVFGTGSFSNTWLPILSGVAVMTNVVAYPDGIALLPSTILRRLHLVERSLGPPGPEVPRPVVTETHPGRPVVGHGEFRSTP
jgi:ABC-type branched-subunit amino acid transport system permease subunit